MNVKKFSAWLVSLLVALVALSTTVAAEGRGGNKIDQDSSDSEVDQDDVLKNDIYLSTGSNGIWSTMGSGGGWGEAALAVTNCQLIVVADMWVGAVSLTSALGLLTDEDLTLEEPLRAAEGNGPRSFDLDAETSTSLCDGSVGPIDIHVATDASWDDPAPLGGSVSGAATALAEASSGWNENEIDQSDLDSDAHQTDIVMNDVDLYLYGGKYGAVAVANCQGIVIAHAGVFAISVTESEADLLDDDVEEPFPEEDTVLELPPLLPASVDVDLTADLLALVIENDTTADATCTQTIDSITISIGDRPDLPPQS